MFREVTLVTPVESEQNQVLIPTKKSTVRSFYKKDKA